MSDNEGLICGALIGVEEKDVGDSDSKAWDEEFNGSQDRLRDRAQRTRDEFQLLDLASKELLMNGLICAIQLVHGGAAISSEVEKLKGSADVVAHDIEGRLISDRDGRLDVAILDIAELDDGGDVRIREEDQSSIGGRIVLNLNGVLHFLTGRKRNREAEDRVWAIEAHLSALASGEEDIESEVAGNWPGEPGDFEVSAGSIVFVLVPEEPDVLIIPERNLVIGASCLSLLAINRERMVENGVVREVSISAGDLPSDAVFAPLLELAKIVVDALAVVSFGGWELLKEVADDAWEGLAGHFAVDMRKALDLVPVGGVGLGDEVTVALFGGVVVCSPVLAVAEILLFANLGGNLTLEAVESGHLLLEREDAGLGLQVLVRDGIGRLQ